MAKITKHSGASYTEHELSDPECPGNSSSESIEMPPTGDDKSRQNPLVPVQTTENPSEAPDKETDSDAPTMATGGPKKTRRPSGK